MNQIPAELGIVASMCGPDSRYATEAVRIVFRDDATFTVEATNGKLAIRVTGFRDVSVEPGEYLIDAVKFERACKVAKAANKRPMERVVAIRKDAVCYRDGEWVTVAAGVEGRFPVLADVFEAKPTGREPESPRVDPKYLALLTKILLPLGTESMWIRSVQNMLVFKAVSPRYQIDAVLMTLAEKPQ